MLADVFDTLAPLQVQNDKLSPCALAPVKWVQNTIFLACANTDMYNVLPSPLDGTNV